MNWSWIRASSTHGRRALVAAVILGLPASLAAAPQTADLGEGLVYFRIHAIPADLPPASTRSAPMVVDLRYATIAESSAAAFDGWIQFHVTAKTPLLLLVNDQTAAGIAAVLANDHGLPGLITIGPAAPGLKPDVIVPAAADVDRRAYDAFERGTKIAALVTENPDKPRADEAALVKERTDSVPTDLDEEEPAAETPPPPPAPPVIDSILQRAIQIHRALLALKRI